MPIDLRLKLKYLCDAYEINELQADNFDFLFFINTNGAEEVIIDSKIHHRIIDPIYEVAQQIGKAQKIEIVKSTNIDPLKWQRYYHKSKLIFFKYEEVSNNTENFVYDIGIIDAIKQHIPSIVLSDEDHLKSIVDYELHVRKNYLDLLKKIKPKVIFLHGFHYQAPLISAANELGILTIDLQHGLQVGWNPLYNKYPELPSSGYQALPDYFAVWGEKEYKNILKTFNSKKHNPIYMGNPWLKRIKMFSQPLSKHLAEKINSYETVILIIMQNQTKIPSIFLEIIEKSGDEILWVIRHHPKGEKYQAKDFSKGNNILIDDEIDQILFNVLFENVDITISEGSTLALEASYFGVTNIITSEIGLENYKEEIEEGTFYYLTQADEFTSILNQINTTNSLSKQDRFKDIEIKEFLLQFINLAEKTQ